MTRRTWAPRGHIPIIRHRFKWTRCSMAAALCYGSRGGGAAVAFHHQPGAYDTDTLIGALDQLRRALGGQKATLLWDGLPVHRSLAMAAWLRRQRHWLVVEPLPGYAPELNPVEALWSNLKGVELANLAGGTLGEVTAAAERGIDAGQERARHSGDGRGADASAAVICSGGQAMSISCRPIRRTYVTRPSGARCWGRGHHRNGRGTTDESRLRARPYE